ncbi:MAG: bifunctional homocysteine S-methyltransferase/methylenetetrahydrofolate reductase [Candidatus Kapabacteria bacterium]|nr:bifunctional homocysteine S-methyltransferase/methylenetetrahydrofolate reductase [Candidatus Kapabacteria bacterium]MDW8012118.1 bifunctional homocysteine S-methyltransferase/methylenetetrahydrofolate reductase [Bacteroidota bacterium]
MKLPFSERLRQGVLVCDGSLEAELWRRGLTEFPPELYVLRQPVIVEEIHRAFVEAGAELVQTNTLRANRLALERYGLAEKVYELNRTGIWLARCAALNRAYTAGVVGPTGRFLAPLGNLSPEEARQVFVEQIVALVDGGAELLLLKGFIELRELLLAIEAARLVSPHLPIVALKAFPEDGAVLMGSFPRKVAVELSQQPVAAIGAAGTVGPQRMVGIARSLISGASLPVAALPDVSVPRIVGERRFYDPDPDYIARKVQELIALGVRIVGVDGGATVECVRAVARAAAQAPPSTVPEIAEAPQEMPSPVSQEKPLPTRFQQALGKRFVVTVELDIPRGLEMASVVEGARFLRRHGIDAVNISDGARARLRMSPIALAYLVQTQAGIECITHIACRDRNIVALQAELLGAHALGVRNILAVTGDPPHIGDYPNATAVFDVDSIGLIRILAALNEGVDAMGNPLGQAANFCIACACNPVAEQWEEEIERLERKVAQGAQVVFTQPVFDVELWELFRSRIAHLPVRVLVGVLPLRSLRHAEFLHYEVPGISIPQWVRQRMARATTPEAAMREGIALAVEFLRAVRHTVDGVYLMPPFRRYDVAVEVLRQAGLLPVLEQQAVGI